MQRQVSEHRQNATGERPRRHVPPILSTLLLALVALHGTPGLAAAQVALRGPRPGPNPVDVEVGLFLVDVVDINEDEQTFEFEAILTMHWNDSRLAFDPAEVGTEERVYQGDYQFAEVFNGWWPQLVLRNESGRYERQGVVLRVSPEGSVSYVEELQAVAEVKMDLRRIPFDRQRFVVSFEVLGFDSDRVRLRPDPGRIGFGTTTLSQWRVDGVEASTSANDSAYLGGAAGRSVSAVTFQFPATRSPHFLLRLIVFPIVILVALTWSVFWMDRESLGSRMDISFIGILTVVAFQIVVSDRLPRISYFTIMSTFMYITYFTLAASVIVNLRVSFLDRMGDVARGNRLDRTCRWLFPLGYATALVASVGYFFLRY